jgi:segregation and condensation protein B
MLPPKSGATFPSGSNYLKSATAAADASGSIASSPRVNALVRRLQAMPALCATMNSRLQPAQQLRSACQRYGGPWTGREWPPAWRAALSRTLTIRLQSSKAAEQEPDSGASDLARLEAILFLAREPLNTRKLSRYANLADGTRARTLIRQLNQRYDATGRAMRVAQVAGGYQLLTRAKLAPWLRRLAHVPGETRLSAPALETLAVIAYRQPVPRADIEAIRGVNCGEILRQLMDRDLVRIASRSEELGRPFLYATTTRFLELFGLNHLDELPRADQLKNTNGLRLVTEAAANQAGIDRPPIDEIGHESTFAD